MKLKLLFLIGLLLLPVCAVNLTACTQQADCLGNTYCSPDANFCVYKYFVQTNQKYVKLNLTSTAVITINVTDPVGRPAEYKLTMTSTSSGRYYAKFYGKYSDTTFRLEANETKEIPLHFTGMAVGTYDVTLQSYDTSYSTTSDCENTDYHGVSNCIDTQVCKFTVSVSGSSGNVVFGTAPGADEVGLIVIVILIAGIYALGLNGENDGGH